jgi:hypothetical protein
MGEGDHMPSPNQLPVSDGPAPETIAKHPDCPQCRQRLAIKHLAPLMFARDIDEIVYGCNECGTELKRTVKRR